MVALIVIFGPRSAMILLLKIGVKEGQITQRDFSPESKSPTSILSLKFVQEFGLGVKTTRCQNNSPVNQMINLNITFSFSWLRLVVFLAHDPDNAQYNIILKTMVNRCILAGTIVNTYIAKSARVANKKSVRLRMKKQFVIKVLLTLLLEY